MKIPFIIRDLIIVPVRLVAAFYIKISNPEVEIELIPRLYLDEDIYARDILATNRELIEELI